jgi:hypothetical protein
MRPAALLAPVREFFLLEASERTIEAYGAEQRRRVAELRKAGDERLRAARRATSPVVACLLLREAVASFALARAAARDANVDGRGFAPKDVALEVPELLPDPVDGTRGDAERVREALQASDLLYVDHLDDAARARLRVALERAVVVLRRGVEARSLLHVRALRWGRLLSLLVVALYVGWLGVRRRVLPVNIALGKPVKVSSYKVNPPDGHELVDGRPGFTYAVHTNTEESPNVVVDLQGDYAVDRVKVYNRADGWWEDSLPLVVEFSRDGKSYTEVARRDSYFEFNDPWVIQASGRMARFVRVRVARRSYLALGRVEIFGSRP